VAAAPEKGLTAPAFSAAAGALAAAAGVCGVLPFAVSLALLAPLIWFQRWRPALIGAAAFLAVFLVAARNEFAARALPAGVRPVACRLTVVLTDDRISRHLAPEELPRLLRADLLELQVAGDPTVRRFPRGLPVLVRAPADRRPGRCGTRYEARGALMPLRIADRDVQSDPYLLRQVRSGRRALCRIRSWRAVGDRATFRGRLAEWRDALLAELFRGVDDPRTRRLAAALYCGITAGVPEAERRAFSAAGIVHVFSVSGMHVAVLALCFGGLLRFLPFRARHPLLVALVWLYVLGTGAGTPAVRAGVMVTLWSALRMALLRLSGVQVLCWTAAPLLIADPGILTAAGAQYSFLITAALISFAELGNRWRFPRREAADYAPFWLEEPAAVRARRCGRLLKTLFGSAGTAFLAGAAITLSGDTPWLGTGAVAANILLALLMPGFFALFFLRLATASTGAGGLTAALFEQAFRLLRGVAAFFGGAFPDVGIAPPHWSVGALYILLLLTALRLRQRRWRFAAGAAVLLLAAATVVRSRTLPPALLIRSAGSGRPAVVAVADPGSRRATIANLPDPESARAAAEFLRRRGFRTVAVPRRAEGGVATRSALTALRRRMELLPAVPRRNAPCRVTPRKNGFRLDYFDPGSKLYFSVVVSDGDDGRTVIVERSGGSVLRRFPWSTRPENWEYEFIE